MRFEAVSTAILGFVVAGGCKVSVNDLIKRPGNAPPPSSSSSGSSSSDADNSEYSAGQRSQMASIAKDHPAGVEGAKDMSREPVVVAAVEGAPKIGPTRPTWCDLPAIKEKAGELPDYTESNMQRAVDDATRWEDFSLEAALSACAAPDGKKIAIQTGYLLQLWANHTGQTAEELVPYIGFAAAGNWDELKSAHCATIKASAEAGKRTKLFAGATASVFDCSGSSSDSLDWEFDRGAAAPSELLRAVQVRRCFAVTDLKPEALFHYGVCGHDAKALDAKALEKEIAGYSDWAKVVARQYHARARFIAAGYERAAHALAKEDPIWQSLLFDVPAQAWKDWETTYQTHRAAIDAAFAYEDLLDGPSKKATLGCLDKAWSSLAGYVPGLHATDLASAKQALMSPVGNLLVRYVSQCTQAEGSELAHNIFAEILTASPSGRGPRYAMSSAILEALIAVKSDRAKFPAEMSWFRFYVAGGTRELLNRDLTSIGWGEYDRGGIIKSVTKSGDQMRVEFKPDKHRERESWCEDTTHVIGWFGDGRPQYEQKCGEGKMITVDLTHQPLLVPPTFAAILKPGQFVRWKQDTKFPGEGNTAHGLPIEIWSNADKQALVGYAGLGL